MRDESHKVVPVKIWVAKVDCGPGQVWDVALMPTTATCWKAGEPNGKKVLQWHRLGKLEELRDEAGSTSAPVKAKLKQALKWHGESDFLGWKLED
jgi:hypothetical protein